MNLSDDQVEQAKQYLLDHRDNFRAFAESDASMVNLFKSGEVVIADGGRGTAQAMIDDGAPGRVDRAEGGSDVVGLRPRDHLEGENIDAAYKLINYYASPGGAGDLRRHGGFVAMNPKALPMVQFCVPEERRSGNLDDAIPRDAASTTPTSTTGHGRKCRSAERCRRTPAPAGRGRERRRPSRPLAPRIRRRAPRLRRRRLLVAFVMLVLFGPVLMLALFSFNDSSIISLPWEGFTTKWYEEAWSNGQARDAVVNSLVVATIVMVLSVILGTLAAWGLTRLRFRGRGFVAGLNGAVLVVPWLIIGVAGLIFFSQISVAALAADGRR